MPLFEGHKDKGVERLFIEMPDHAKDQVIWKWPDAQIMQHSIVNVDVDYQAVFTNLGKVIGVLPPGRHQLTEGASVLFGWLVDRVTGDGYYDAEVYFVATRDIPGLRFGGPVDNLVDGPSGLVVSVRVFGELAFRAIDPIALLTKLAGSSGDGDHNQPISAWVGEQALAAIRAVLPEIVAGHGVLAMGQIQDQTAGAAAAKANTVLGTWGLQITGFAELNVNLPDEDAGELKQLAATKVYTGIAGSFGEAVRAEATLEIAHGVASGHVGADQGLFAGMLLGVAPGGGIAPGGVPGVPGAGGAGGAGVPAGGGAAPGGLAPAASAPAQFCSSCGQALPPSARFCPGCGRAVTA